MRPFTLHSLSACLATKSPSTGAEGDTSHRAQASLSFEDANFRWITRGPFRYCEEDRTLRAASSDVRLDGDQVGEDSTGVTPVTFRNLCLD
jgi:hypothetical protein